MEIDKSNDAQKQRQKFIELAISEIAAYKESAFTACNTDKLIASAYTIGEFIKNGTVQNQP